MTDREKAIALLAYNAGQLDLGERLRRDCAAAATIRAEYIRDVTRFMEGHGIAWTGTDMSKRSIGLRSRTVSPRVALDPKEAGEIEQALRELFG